MKRIYVIIIALLITTSSFSQDDFQTIFGSDVSFSGYGGPFMSFTSINGEFAHMMGGGGGVLLNKRFFFGGFGMGNTTKHKVNYIDPNTFYYPNINLDFGYGGLYFGYIISPNNSIHPAVFLQSGWGDIALSNNGNTIITDNVFVLNPSAQLEINMTTFFRIGIGVNYQFVNGVNLSGLNNEDFTNFGGFLSFKFGWFN